MERYAHRENITPRALSAAAGRDERHQRSGSSCHAVGAIGCRTSQGRETAAELLEGMMMVGCSQQRQRVGRLTLVVQLGLKRPVVGFQRVIRPWHSAAVLLILAEIWGGRISGRWLRP